MMKPSNQLNSEKKRYQYSTEEKLIKDYNPELRRIETRGVFDRLFGMPPEESAEKEQNSFWQDNIEAVTIVGFGKNLDQTHTLHIHKELIPTVQRLFEHLLKFNKKLPPEHRYYLQADEQTHGWDHRYDRESNGTKTLSPHAWGIAIDLNKHENGGDSWSIPRWVVKLFESYGFRWGGFGFNHVGDKEPDHFEYALHEINPILPLETPLFPFAKSDHDSESAMRNFYRNESNIGGYFPLTMNNEALHGGVHLHPDKPGKPQAVRVSHPGYVVAARIAPSISNAEVNAVAHVGNYTGFVVIRHEIRKPGETEYKSLYSLYMHLKPVDTANLSPGRPYHWQQAGWLRKLYQHRHGSVVCVNSPEDIGKQGWLHEQFSDGAAEVPIFGEKEWKKETIKAGTGEGPCFLSKPEPKDMEKVIEAFEKGEMITFTQPFLTVKAGEIIGFTVSPPTHGSSAIAKFKRSLFTNFQKDFVSGFLHWELFTPAEEKTLHELLELMEINKEEITEATQKGNTIDRDKLAQLASELESNEGDKTLPKLQRKTARANVAYSLELVRFMNNPKGFGREGDDDQIKKDQLEGPGYPMRLAFENFSGEPLPNTNFPCTVIFQKGPGKEESHQITIQGKEEVSVAVDLQVPVETDQIRLESEELGLDWRYKIDPEDPWFGKVIARRWRDRILTHENEWHEKPMTDFVQVRKERKEFNEKSSIKDLETFLWWDEKQQNLTFTYEPPKGGTGTGTVELDPFGENKTSSLFGSAPDQLPEMTDLTNINPITGVWLLALLKEREQIEIRDTWDPELSKDESELLYLGWGAENETGDGIDWKPENAPIEERAIPYGRNSYIAAVYLREFDTPTEITIKSPTGETVTLFSETCADGKLVRQLPCSFWGDWQVEATGKQSIYQKGKLPTKITGIKPEIGQLPPPERITGNRYRWEIPVKSGTADRLQGLVMVRYHIAKKETGAWHNATKFEMSEDGAYVIDSSSPRNKVSRNFSFAEYFRKRDRDAHFRLSHRLLDAVQAFRSACGVGVNIQQVYNDTGLSVIVRVGHRLRPNTTEEKRKSTKKAVAKGLAFLKKELEKEDPIFTPNSGCQESETFSQHFHLEVPPQRFERSGEDQIAEVAIPVDSNLSDGKLSRPLWFKKDSKKLFYQDIFADADKSKRLGSTFTFEEYRSAQQRVNLPEKLLDALVFLTNGIGKRTENNIVLDSIAESGLELSIKEGKKRRQQFNDCSEKLIELKNSLRINEEGETVLSVANRGNPERLRWENEDEAKEILSALNKYIEQGLLAKRYGKELQANFEGEATEAQINEPLLKQFAFLYIMIGPIDQITGLSADGKTIRFVPASQYDLDRLIESLQRLDVADSGDLTLSIPAEESGNVRSGDSGLNQHVMWNTFREAFKIPKVKIAHALVELVDSFQSEVNNIQLQLTWIDEEGLTARVAPFEKDKESWQQLRKAAESIENSKDRITALTDSQEIELSTKTAETSTEQIQRIPVTFNATKAFQKVLEQESLDQQDQLRFAFGFRCLNGGFLLLDQPEPVSGKEEVDPIPLFTPDKENYLDRWSQSISERVNGSKLAFGTITVNPLYQTTNGSISFSVPLIGDKEHWQQAKPMLEVKIGDETMLLPYERGTLYQWENRISFPLKLVKKGKYFDENRLTKEVTVTARVEKQEEFPCEDQKRTFPSLMPDIKLEKGVLGEEKLTLHFAANCWPANIPLKLYPERKSGKTGKYEPIAAESLVDESAEGVFTPGISYSPASAHEGLESETGNPNEQGMTVTINHQVLFGNGEYRFRLDRPGETPKERTIFGREFVPIIGTFKTTPFKVDITKMGISAVEQGNIIVKIVSAEVDEKSGDLEIVYDYRNWPVGKELRLVFYRKNRYTREKVEESVDTGNTDLVTYDPPSDPEKWEGKTYGKAEGKGTLTVRFNQLLLKPDSEYILELAYPKEEEEIQPGVVFKPCELRFRTEKTKATALKFNRGRKAKNEGILKDPDKQDT